MKKCTLCIDRIYNDHLSPEDRVPACVRACPTGARHFGDLGDPQSAVSQLVRARGGFALLPEFGYRPVNKYLPPRPRRDAQAAAAAAVEAGAGQTAGASATAAAPGAGAGSTAERLFAWIDQMLSR
jgi:hypothetical protein